MRALVVGGAGFIGSNLVDTLVDDGCDVTVIDNLSTGNYDNINEKVSFYERDITTMDDFSMFDGIDVVFHLAAKARVQPSITDPVGYNKVNVEGLINILEASVKYKVKRFVFSSSSSVYGEPSQMPTTEEARINPMSPYALQKLVGEQYCKLYSTIHGLETVSLRYFNVYGERQLTEGAYCCVMGIFINQLRLGEPMTIRGDGEQRRDFTYVGDVVDANIKAAILRRKFSGEVFNIGCGDNKSVNELADMVGPGKPYETIEPVIEPRQTLADNYSAEMVLGWKPKTKIEDWVESYMEKIGL